MISRAIIVTFLTAVSTLQSSSGYRFQCPGPGFFPDPESCTSFYRCVNKSTSYKYICPHGTRYDPRVNNCNHVFLVPFCFISVMPAEPPPIILPPPRPPTTTSPPPSSTTVGSNGSGVGGDVSEVGAAGGSVASEGGMAMGSGGGVTGGSGGGADQGGGSGGEAGSGGGADQSGGSGGTVGSAGGEVGQSGGNGGVAGSVGGVTTGSGGVVGSGGTTGGEATAGGVGSASGDQTQNPPSTADDSSENNGMQGEGGASESASTPATAVTAPTEAPMPAKPEYAVSPMSIYACPEPGYFFEASNCRQFYACKEVSPGVLSAERIFKCPKRYLFDIKTNLCQREEKVTCAPGSLKDDLYYSLFLSQLVVELQEEELGTFFSQPLTLQGQGQLIKGRTPAKTVQILSSNSISNGRPLTTSSNKWFYPVLPNRVQGLATPFHNRILHHRPYHPKYFSSPSIHQPIPYSYFPIG